jgi:FkbM family methyltransferase
MKRSFKEFVQLFLYSRKMFMQAMIYILLNMFNGKNNKKTRIRNLYIGKTLSLKLGNENIIINGKDFGLAREIYINRVYFQLPGFNISQDDIVFDVGANVGIFTLYAAKFGRHVYSIEVLPDFVEEMRNNLIINGCIEKATLINALVGHEIGKFSKRENLVNAAHSALEPEIESINQIISKHKVNKINFMKVDIEGSEFALFAKNNNWLSIVDKIAMEVHPEYGNITALGKVLKDNGFHVWYIDERSCKIVKQLDKLGYIFAKKTIFT